MKLVYINYADDKYEHLQKRCLQDMQTHGSVDDVIPYTREWLKSTEFYINNKEILDMERGAGYWMWKPFIILDALNNIKEGDSVLYVDCGDRVNAGIGNYVRNSLEANDVLLVRGIYSNRCWTKRDCFSLMNCDDESYWNAVQLEAGVCAFKKNKRTINLLNEWLTFCGNKHILTDLENTCGEENFPCFQDHRHDQSILTNLAVKYNLPVDSGTIRNYVTCNAYA